jgi:hypothetical protein
MVNGVVFGRAMAVAMAKKIFFLNKNKINYTNPFQNKIRCCWLRFIMFLIFYFIIFFVVLVSAIMFTVAPEIDKSPTMLRAASGAGERARLPCRAQVSLKCKM